MEDGPKASAAKNQETWIVKVTTNGDSLAGLKTPKASAAKVTTNGGSRKLVKP